MDNLYLKFGASDNVYGIGEEVDNLKRRAMLAELRLIPVKMRHLGTERSRQVLKAMRDFIAPKVEMRFGEAATKIIVDGGLVSGIETSRGENWSAGI